ncbi:mCG1041740 [Mus musculus]|nr:mCG1041740 [Mus musculus]
MAPERWAVPDTEKEGFDQSSMVSLTQFQGLQSPQCPRQKQVHFFLCKAKSLSTPLRRD